MAFVKRGLGRWGLAATAAMILSPGLPDSGFRLALAFADDKIVKSDAQTTMPKVEKRATLTRGPKGPHDGLFTDGTQQQIPAWLDVLASKNNAVINESPKSGFTRGTSTPQTSLDGAKEAEPGLDGTLSGFQENSSFLQEAEEDLPKRGGRPWHRRLAVENIRGTLGRFIERLRRGVRPFVQPQIEEEPGQNYVARLVRKVKFLRWFHAGARHVKDIIGRLVGRRNDEICTLTNGTDTREVSFVRILQSNPQFADLLVREGSMSDWVGRMYVESQWQEAAAKALERDFAISNCAPEGESIEGFRHRLRLDIPTDLYMFDGFGSFVESPTGQVFLNAVARRPLIRTTVDDITSNMKSTKKSRPALLSITQQAVRAVANLHSQGMVHTSISPGAFLASEKGLVFLGNLQHIVPEGSDLPMPLEAQFIPPELNDESNTNPTADPVQDSWALGKTLYSFWCGEVQDGSASLVFADCRAGMQPEIKSLIEAFTKREPGMRLLASEAVLNHPAMLLPMAPGLPPLMDLEQDDIPDEDDE